METALIIIGAPALLIIIYIAATYNSLIALRNHIKDAWANIDTELKRRYELIPNLVAVVKGYAAHEKEVLEKVTELRAKCMANNGPTAEQASDEKQLVTAMQKLIATVERYPDLKADQHYLELQRELVNTEDRIQAARRFFNGNVRDYRNKREMFPSSIIAGMFSFQQMDFFEVEPVVREPVSVDL